jgi:hypothetical protein
MKHLLIAIAASSLLVACGGGGGGSSSTPSAPSGGGSAAATPTPTATPAALTGTVADLGAQRYSGDGNAAGAALVGATVVVGSTLIVGATPPATIPAGDVSTTTSVSGGFSVSATTPTYVMVFPASTDTTHISLHALTKVTSGAIRPLYLYAPNAMEVAELAQVNTDRTTNGAGIVVPDEIAFETARAHSDFEAANGYDQHCIPASNCYVTPGASTTPPASYAPQYVSPDDIYNYLDGAKTQTAGTNNIENTYFEGAPPIFSPTWAAADAVFMAEKGTANDDHYLNIVNTQHVWVGLGSNLSGLTSTGATTFAPFLQEFL